MSNTFKVGDTVRIELEAKIDQVDGDDETFIQVDGMDVQFYPSEVTEGVVTKVEPAFRVGDLVRSKTHGYQYLLLGEVPTDPAEEGSSFRYFSLSDGSAMPRGRFVKERYEVIARPEVSA